MYVPRHFEVTDTVWCHALMRAQSFALMVTADDAGAPFVTHLPLLADGGRGAPRHPPRPRAAGQSALALPGRRPSAPRGLRRRARLRLAVVVRDASERADLEPPRGGRPRHGAARRGYR